MQDERAEPRADFFRLNAPKVVERHVALALQPRLHVPVGLAVADEVERVAQGRAALVRTLPCERGANGLTGRKPMVPRGGIEPPTLRFSVACSTN